MAQEIQQIDKITQRSENIIVTDYKETITVGVGVGQSIEITKEQVATLRLMLFNIQ